MTPTPAEERDAHDRAFAERLAAYDEAVAAGRNPDASGPPDADPSDRRWEDAAAVVDLLRRVKGPSAAPHVGEATPPARLTLSLTPVPDEPRTHPERIGRFTIDRVLGRGGVGVVYGAFDPSLQRQVAIKVLSSHDAETLARFSGEAASLASLQHPNIVQIFEQGVSADGAPFLVMEYVEGRTLRQAAEAGPLPDREAARLVAEVARAVEAAHQVGVWHRDLKPANVLLTREGAPKVIDFGLARRIGSGERVTETGVALGTPGYMSPEQAAGRCRAADASVDVYGLGAVLYELLTARPPFEGLMSFDVLRQIIHERPAPVRRHNPAASPSLEAVCLKCLEKRPADRYPSAAALADDLDRFLAGQPTLARPGARRRKFVVAGALLAVLVALGGLGWRLSDGPEPDPGSGAERVADVVTPVGIDGPPMAPPPRRRVPALVEKRVIGRLDRPARVLSSSADGRVVAAVCGAKAYIWSGPGEAPVREALATTGPSDDEYVMTVAVSPDGGRVAVSSSFKGRVRPRTTLYSWADRTATTWEDDTAVTAMAFSPDSRLLALGHLKGATSLYTPGKDRLDRYQSQVTASSVAVAFSHDSRAFASVHQLDRALTYRRLGSQVQIQIPTTGQVIPGGIAVSTDDEHFLVVTPDRIAVLELASHSCIRLIPNKLRQENYQFTAVAVGPSGRWVLTSGRDETVRIWEIESGRELANIPMKPAASVLTLINGGRTVIAGTEDVVREFELTGVE